MFSQKNTIKMEKIRRIIIGRDKENKDIKYFGYNSNGVLSIVLEDDTVINIKDKELENLKEFLNNLEEI